MQTRLSLQARLIECSAQRNRIHVSTAQWNRLAGKPRDKGLEGVEHALDILACFLQKEDMGVTDLSRRLNISKSATHRLVQTLAGRGFLEQTEQRRYQLGFALIELGNAYRCRMELTRIAEPILNRLSRRLQGNAHLAKLDGDEVVDLIRIENPSPVRLNRIAVLRRPAHATALGKVLLAGLGEEEKQRLSSRKLARLTRATITDPARLLEELRRVREKGYAVDNEEYSEGIRCLAAPVFDESGTVVAAVSVTGVVSHLTCDRVPAFAQETCRSAAEISRRLGYRAAGAELAD
jgi:DNA-binding IclR family transcriptional regulator